MLKCSQCVQKTRLEDLAPMAKAFFRSHQSLSHVKEMLAAKIFHLPTFEQVPHALLRVQVRSIAGKALQMKPLGCPGRQKRLDDLRTVDGGAIPNHQELARDLAQQQA